MGVLSTLRGRVAAALSPVTPRTGAWWPVVHEPYTGAWQRNDPLTIESALSNPSIFGVVSRITGDIAKIAPPLLLALDDQGFWTETTNSAYTPVLRRPNRYQTPQQFFEQWMLSKLLHGNTYVWKDRDERGVVKALYILDPVRVKILEAPDGSIYYELQPNTLAGLAAESAPIVVPAREVIHDRWHCHPHPLVGVSPLYALAGAVSQAAAIQSSSTAFFGSGARTPFALIAPTPIDPLTGDRMKAEAVKFQASGTLVLDRGVKVEPLPTSAADTQLIAQLGWTEETICKVFGMPISILNSAKQPPYANAEASQLQYKSQCLEPHLVSIAATLSEGLELPLYLTLEFDDTLLIWMDTTTRTTAAKTAISAGMSVNEVRDTYYGLGPVPGGELPYLQQQYYSLAALADRDAGPAATPATPTPPAPPEDPSEEAVAATVGDLSES